MPASGPKTGPFGPFGISTWPGGERRDDAPSRRRALAHRARSLRFTLPRDASRPDAARWFLQSSRTPSTTEELLEPQSRLGRSPVFTARRRPTLRCTRLFLGGPPPCGASQSDLSGDRGRRPRRRPTRLRLLAGRACYPDPQGPDTSCRDVAVSRESARGEPLTSPGKPAVTGVLPEDRFARLPAKEDRLRLPEVPSVHGYSVKSRGTRCHPRTSAHFLPRRATAFDDSQPMHGPGKSSA